MKKIITKKQIIAGTILLGLPLIFIAIKPLIVSHMLNDPIDTKLLLISGVLWGLAFVILYGSYILINKLKPPQEQNNKKLRVIIQTIIYIIVLIILIFPVTIMTIGGPILIQFLKQQ